MIRNPMDVISRFPVRKNKRQKRHFRKSVRDYVTGLGYACEEEACSFGGKNLVIGDPRKAKYLVTAHYDTCARLPIPNFITPCNFFVFLLYQLLLTVLIFLLAGIVGCGIFCLTKDGFLSFWCWYLGVVILFILMMVGPANKHNVNDNTSGVVTLLEIARSLPESQRNTVCFVLFDLEEAGLLGSSGYSSKHKNEIRNQVILNLDCVGDGDEILFFPTKSMKNSAGKMEWLCTASGISGEKSVQVCKKGFAFYPSDQANFPYGVGICALHRNPVIGLYLGRIHTSKDTVLDITNVNTLRDCLIRLMNQQ